MSKKLAQPHADLQLLFNSINFLHIFGEYLGKLISSWVDGLPDELPAIVQQTMVRVATISASKVSKARGFISGCTVDMAILKRTGWTSRNRSFAQQNFTVERNHTNVTCVNAAGHFFVCFYARKRFYVGLSWCRASKIALSPFCAFLVQWSLVASWRKLTDSWVPP